MPEEPAIVILKEKLQVFVGLKVLDADTTTFNILPEHLTDYTLVDIVSHGKQLFLCFDGFSLRIHLLLFGSYTFNSGEKGKLSLSLVFENGTVSFYSSHVKLIKGPLEKLLDFRTDVSSELWDEKYA